MDLFQAVSFIFVYYVVVENQLGFGTNCVTKCNIMTTIPKNKNKFISVEPFRIS